MFSEPWGFIKDPIYGYVAFTQLEKDVIDTKVVQRLRRLRQLAGAEFLYPGANHTRFEHSLGAMHLAGVLASETTLPVIGVPIASSPLGGIDALFSTIQMPSGIPVAGMGIGKSGAKNAALFALEILAIENKKLKKKIDSMRKKWNKKR